MTSVRDSRSAGVLLRCVLAALTLLTLHPAVAAAHLGLRSATPAEGARLAAAPTEIRLTFTQRLPATGVRVALTVDGRALDAIASVTVDSADRRVAVVSLRSSSGAGAYALEWRTIGADGHPVTGTLRFTVLGPAPDSGAHVHDTTPAITAPPSADSTHDGHAAAGLAPHDDGSRGLATRTFGFLALLLAIGAAAVALRVLPNVRASLPPDEAVAADGFVRGLGRAAAAASLLHAGARLWLQAQVAGIGGDGTPGDLTAWGQLASGGAGGAGFLLQLGASIVAFLAFTRRQMSLAGLSVIALAAVPALSGHAIAQSAAAAATDWLHVAGAGVWLGSLSVVSLLFLRPGGLGVRHPAAATAAIRAFSPMALAASTAVMASGIASSAWRLGGIPSDLSDPYLQWLLAKGCAVAVVVGLGAFNWRRVLPSLGSDAAGTARLARSAWLEVAVGLVIVTLTAVLVFVPRPALSR